MTDRSKESAPIPKLELEKFTFLPPGPMGWSMSEYEKMLNEDGAGIVPTSNNSFRPEVNLEGKQLVEMGLSQSKNEIYIVKENLTVSNEIEKTVVETNKEVEDEVVLKHAESENLEEKAINQVQMSDEELKVEQEPEPEPVKPKYKVTIIIQEESFRKPWISPTTQSRKNRGHSTFSLRQNN
jgi:hypothetical protein